MEKVKAAIRCGSWSVFPADSVDTEVLHLNAGSVKLQYYLGRHKLLGKHVPQLKKYKPNKLKQKQADMLSDHVDDPDLSIGSSCSRQ